MGMLGHGDTQSVHEPKQVHFFRDMKIVAVATGGHTPYPGRGSFTLFLTENNELWVAGMLGGPIKHIDAPVKVPTPRNSHILSVSAGEDWAAIVCSSRTTN